MSKAHATIGDWIALSKTVYHALYIGNMCRKLNQNVEIFRKIGTAFTDDLQRCASLIFKTIDLEESRKSKSFVVKANIDEALDEKKRLYNGLPDIMAHVARQELESLSEDIKQCFVNYLPQVGYLLVIDLPEGRTEDEDHNIEGLQFIFATNNQLYYKSARTKELDNQLGDIQLEIADLEINIQHGLQTAILECTKVLQDVMEMTAELDCLMALAACANEFGYVRPELVQENILDIKNGRHPLQELCCSPYVANDTKMGGHCSKMKLITGPNACGKSVYLKQVGLIVYMAHIGSFVPAESAKIGPVDQILSRIKCVESVSGGLSTFMQDCLQISHSLRVATCHSLVIVDEYGKGTESTDGVSLLAAVLKHWLSKGPSCPLVLVSTHYHSIIQRKLIPASPHIQFLTLDTMVNGEELVFLYQLKEGFATSSYACNIATQVGLPDAIVQRAQLVSELLGNFRPVPHMKDGNSDKRNKTHKKIVDAFLQLNLNSDNLHGFLKDAVLPHIALDSTEHGTTKTKKDPRLAESNQSVKVAAKQQKVTQEVVSSEFRGQEHRQKVMTSTTSDDMGKDSVNYSFIQGGPATGSKGNRAPTLFPGFRSRGLDAGSPGTSSQHQPMEDDTAAMQVSHNASGPIPKKFSSSNIDDHTSKVPVLSLEKFTRTPLFIIESKRRKVDCNQNYNKEKTGKSGVVPETSSTTTPEKSKKMDSTKTSTLSASSSRSNVSDDTTSSFSTQNSRPKTMEATTIENLRSESTNAFSQKGKRNTSPCLSRRSSESEIRGFKGKVPSGHLHSIKPKKDDAGMLRTRSSSLSANEKTTSYSTLVSSDNAKSTNTAEKDSSEQNRDSTSDQSYESRLCSDLESHRDSSKRLRTKTPIITRPVNTQHQSEYSVTGSGSEMRRSLASSGEESEGKKLYERRSPSTEVNCLFSSHKKTGNGCSEMTDNDSTT